MTKANPDLAPPWLPIAVVLTGAGLGHLIMPRPWEYLIPEQLGNPKPWVRWSGIAELGIATGLAVPKTRRLAGLAAAALFVGVFPGNIEMARKALRSERSSTAWKVGNVARLPLQIPLVTRSLRIARAAKG